MKSKRKAKKASTPKKAQTKSKKSKEPKEYESPAKKRKTSPRKRIYMHESSDEEESLLENEEKKDDVYEFDDDDDKISTSTPKNSNRSSRRIAKTKSKNDVEMEVEEGSKEEQQQRQQQDDQQQEEQQQEEEEEVEVGTNILMEVPIMDENTFYSEEVTATVVAENVSRDPVSDQVENTKDSSDVNSSQSANFEMNDRDEIVCSICQQKLEGIRYCTRPPNAKSEQDAILDSRLAVLDGQEKNEHSLEDTRAYNKITSFSVYCKTGHLCPFDAGLIEKDRNIYFSGYLKPIFEEDPSIDGVAIAGENFGPIVEWWTTGFDAGEQMTVGLTTELGDYVLMEPAPEYSFFLENTMIKSFISKTVIEYILGDMSASYEDLMRKIQTTKMPGNKPELFTEDNLMHFAPFICSQMISFDELADPKEPILICAPCIRRVIDLAGIDFRYKNAGRLQSRRIAEETMKSHKERQEEETLITTSETSDDGRLMDAILSCNQIKISAKTKKYNTRKCDSCDNCQRSKCGECAGCSQKKACWRKRCFWSKIQEANKEDEEDRAYVSPKDVLYSNEAFMDKIPRFKEYKRDVALLGSPVAFSDENVYYESAKVAGLDINLGDFVVLHPDDSSTKFQVMKVVSLYEDKAANPKFHAIYYWWGLDTVLGQFAHPRELFNVGLCNDLPLFSIRDKVKVLERQEPLFWKEMVGDRKLGKDTYFCEKSFEALTGRFCDLPEADDTSRPKTPPSYRICKIQANVKAKDASKIPRVSIKIGEDENKTIYQRIRYKEEDYFVGTTVYVKPRKLYFLYPKSETNVKTTTSLNKASDMEKYPERYRKGKSVVKDLQIPPPMDIGMITQIFTVEEKVFIKVRKFYRPENTHDGKNLSKKANMNVLFWSSEETTIEFSHVVGKCYVAHEKSLSTTVHEWTAGGPDRFYFSKEYANKEFTDVNFKDIKNLLATHDTPKEYPKTQKLNTLNIFAGCGGLALGLQRSGLAKISWAIEPDTVAATVFEANMKKTIMFNADVRFVMDEILKNKFELDGKKLPEENAVELLCGTIPGKNFKSLENFKNSHVATFIEYCEYYRPVIFILDADENLIKENDFLKLTLSSFITIGYQVAFNVMQVGNYGAPQNRTRSVLMGAAPGNKLPEFPKVLHSFPKSLSQFLIVVDDKKYSPIADKNGNLAPFRAVTVHDAISDMPAISCTFGEQKTNWLYYSGKFLTHYQKNLRVGMPEDVIFDHECKTLGVLVQTRLIMLSQSVGTDWQDLPNIEMKLSDGTMANKLVYTHVDLEAGRSSNGELRGVCSCANGGVCDISYRQENTLIPWHLVHTAKRHKQWAGLYGRLQWDGFFENITNPEPLGTEGPVIHPHEPRFVSVRECARSQGFPDEFQFGEEVSTHDKYRLIGQAPSPLLYICLGQEILKSLV